MFTTLGAYVLHQITSTLLFLLPPLSGPVVQAVEAVSSGIEAQLEIVRLIAMGA